MAGQEHCKKRGEGQNMFSLTVNHASGVARVYFYRGTGGISACQLHDSMNLVSQGQLPKKLPQLP